MKTKPGELRAYWGRRENDMMFDWGGEGASRADGHLLHGAFNMKRLTLDFQNGGEKWECSLAEELESRGYDLTTLRFSIRQKPRSR